MSIGKTLNENHAETSNREWIYLGLCRRAVVVNDMTDNPSLRNESKTLLLDAQWNMVFRHTTIIKAR